MKQRPRPGGNQAAALSSSKGKGTPAIGAFATQSGGAKEAGRVVELKGATSAGHLWRGGGLRDRVIR